MKSQIAAKLTRLIQDEVNKQLAENYYELLPNLIKTEVTQIEDDLQFAVGAAYFQIDERRLFIPILYTDGQVDAISYIADVETNRMYGLTKKMYKRLISANRLQLGTALTKAEQDRLKVDKGIIGRLFATPQTLSAKIASDETMDTEDVVMMACLENPSMRERFTKMASSDEYCDRLEAIYSPVVFEKLASLNDRAPLLSFSAPKERKTYRSLAELKDVEPELMKEAAFAIAKNGYYKTAAQANVNTGSKAAVLSIPKMGEQLFKTQSELKVLTVPGTYNALTKNLDIVPVVVAEDSGVRRIYYKGMNDTVSRDQANGPELTQYIGMPAGALGGDPRHHITAVFGKAVKPKAARRILISIRKDDLKMYDIGNLTPVGDTTVITSFSWGTAHNEVTIEISERFGYSKRGNTIFINPKHVTFIGGSKESALTSSYDKPSPSPLKELLVSDDMEQAFIKTASITIQYSAGMYDYERERLSGREMHEKLAFEGYDGESIDLIMKTAEAKPGMPAELQNIPQTLKAILAELAENRHSIMELKQMITGGPQPEGGAEGEASSPEDEQIKQQITEVAQSVGADGNSIIQGGTQQGMALPQILEQLQGEVAQVQQQGGAQADPMAQGAEPGTAPQPQAQGPGQVPSQGPGQPQGQVPGQTPGEATPQGLQEEGYNTQMSPQMLDQLQSVADKDVLNASIIQYLIDTPDAKGVVGQYLDDVEKGVNGLAKTMLTVEIQKKSFSKDVSEGKLVSFINGGKTILNRLTDFVIDAAQID